MECCPICRSTDIKIIATRFRNIIDAKPQLAICNRCDHWCVAPLPNKDDLHHFYSKLLAMDTDEYLSKYRNKKLRIFQRLLEHRLSLPENPVVVEVGPGPIGITPIVPSGAHYVAIEPGSKNNRLLLESAHAKRLTLTCLEDIDELNLSDFTADLIFSNASFEHMLSPRDVLNKLKRHMKPDCWVVIGVPARQVEFPDEALVRSGLYAEIDYCRTHLHSFSSQSMRLLFSSAKIELIAEFPTLLPARMASYDSVFGAWYEFADQRKKALSIRWQLKYLFRLLYHRIVADRIIDPTPNGDDRGEILYVGRSRH